MKKIILLLVGFFLINSNSFAQISNEKILFVIDSIPVIDDPSEGNNIVGSDVSDMNVIKNKDTIKYLGYENFDGVTFVFTKEYRKRPDSLKRFPSAK